MMIYKKSILSYLFVTAGFLLFATTWGFSQTCCSGGVPLSGNIGFEGADRGSIQMELSYDLNYLATLKIGSDVYADENRQRITQSLLFKGGYSVKQWFAIDVLFTYVFQQRKNTFLGETNLVNTHGLGDAVIMAKFIPFRIVSSGYELQFGAGPKIPLGQSNLTDERGLTLNADLQPGSGSWDAITWGYFAKQLKSRPSSVLSVRIVGRFNGVNRDYFGSQIYQFGNSVQAYLGIGDQILFGKKIISPSLSLRYRHARADKINDQVLDNTGGQWINVIPAISWQIRQNTILHLIPEIPLYSNVEGIQLTPTFRMQLGIYHRFGGKKENKPNIYLL